MDWKLFIQVSIWIFGSLIVISAGVDSAIKTWKGKQ